ncbi:unnamed protein product, partial [Brassica oleracea]
FHALVHLINVLSLVIYDSARKLSLKICSFLLFIACTLSHLFFLVVYINIFEFWLVLMFLLKICY